jgi:hypothetical protein
MVLEGKYVCANCFHDYAVREFINSHLKRKTCTYCNSKSSQRISASLREVLAFMMDGIRCEWVPCTPQVEWETESLGWHGGRHGRVSSDYMVQDVLPQLATENAALLKDIVSFLPSDWRRRMRYDPELEDIFSYRWDEFAEAVKYRTRYVYYRVNKGWQEDVARGNNSPIFRIRAAHVLEEVLDRIADLSITESMSPGKRIWRARSHGINELLNTPEQLGPPSIEEALVSTRMSPAGIPVFYGAFDRNTAITETLRAGEVDGTSKSITVGKWRTTKRLRVLNLADIPATPSLFDAKMRRLRSAVSFLESFSDEISRPIEKDGSEHIEYVPTQVFAEYIKHAYTDSEGVGLDGVLYKSTVRNDGINCVLFVTKNECLNDERSMGPRRTKSKQKMLLETSERVSRPEAELLLSRVGSPTFW